MTRELGLFFLINLFLLYFYLTFFVFITTNLGNFNPNSDSNSDNLLFCSIYFKFKNIPWSYIPAIFLLHVFLLTIGGQSGHGKTQGKEEKRERSSSELLLSKIQTKRDVLDTGQSQTHTIKPG